MNEATFHASPIKTASSDAVFLCLHGLNPAAKSFINPAVAIREQEGLTMEGKVRIGEYVKNGTLSLPEKIKATMGHPNFHRSYMKAARKLLSNSTDHELANENVLPIFFLQRHSLELLLKNSLLVIYETMLLQNKLDSRWEKPCERKIKRATESHDLNELFVDLKASLFLDDNPASDPVIRLEKFVNTIHGIDKRGTIARYDSILKSTCERSLRKPIKLDIQENQNELEKLSKLLLGSELEFQDAMMSEYYHLISSCKSQLQEREDATG